MLQRHIFRIVMPVKTGTQVRLQRMTKSGFFGDASE
jgi:hypothetical protein